MKKIHYYNFIKLFSSGFVACTLLFITACQHTEQPEQAAKFAQVKYTAKQINHWLDSAKTNNFVFQFYSPKIENVKKPYQLISYIIDSAGNYLNASNPDTLATANDSLAGLTGKAILGNNFVSKKTILEITTDSLGKKRPYDYLLFIPKLHQGNEHIVYEVRLFKGSLDVDYRRTGVSTYVDSNPSPPATMQTP
jgi:hypothetical protein